MGKANSAVSAMIGKSSGIGSYATQLKTLPSNQKAGFLLLLRQLTCSSLRCRVGPELCSCPPPPRGYFDLSNFSM